ncbi:hypothetical protein [Paenibacillus sp. B01]|uniref:hypothetical protein n=1 Tax=Paenibacillus sp. B01 TaxID=2660554 RepID=UPI00129B2BE0|nr:hypothetical protein [Paenibacillus sp. B01]QGG54453.1 hypothetical protein GE073_01765 [Paenibacillus sp. B01]
MSRMPRMTTDAHTNAAHDDGRAYECRAWRRTRARMPRMADAHTNAAHDGGRA